MTEGAGSPQLQIPKSHFSSHLTDYLSGVAAVTPVCVRSVRLLNYWKRLWTFLFAFSVYFKAKNCIHLHDFVLLNRPAIKNSFSFSFYMRVWGHTKYYTAIFTLDFVGRGDNSAFLSSMHTSFSTQLLPVVLLAGFIFKSEVKNFISLFVQHLDLHPQGVYLSLPCSMSMGAHSVNVIFVLM